MKRSHGLSSTRVYKAWHGIRQRMNPKWKFYYNYGGRGIKVCSFISDSLGNFINLMGDVPEGCTLDRIDNDGHYSCGSCPECKSQSWPMNVRWATRKEQSRNRRNSRFVVVNGNRMTLAEAAEKAGVTMQSMWKRVNKGKNGSNLLLPRNDSLSYKYR